LNNLSAEVQIDNIEQLERILGKRQESQQENGEENP
jgi:hypothetical protein